MRAILTFCLLICAGVGARADEVGVTAPITTATLYPQGATIEREAAFDLPAGAHELIVDGLPRTLNPDRLRVTAEGVQIGAVSFRTERLPAPQPADSAQVTQARAALQAAEQLLRAARDRAQGQTILIEAAQARIAFLSDIGAAPDLAAQGADGLRALAAMIGDETLAARQRIQEARIARRDIETDITELESDVARARAALDALQPQPRDTARLRVAVTAAQALQGRLRLSYQVDNAGWTPVNDYFLMQSPQPVLRIARGALVWQGSGEDWQDVALTLSTARPSQQFSPSNLSARLVRVIDPPPPRKEAPQDSMRATLGAPAPMVEPVAEESIVTATAMPAGLNIVYTYPLPVTLASQAEALRLVLGTVETDASLVAQAVPLYDETAFLLAGFTNDTGEVLLPSRGSSLYLDGGYVGSLDTALVAAGDQSELSFGPIDGLRLGRVIEDRQQGDRGVLSRATDRAETVRITLRNLTGRAWPVRLLDRVPYSEQQELEVTWSADPAPDTVDYDDRRGVLAWRFDLPGGATREITLSHRLRWPEGKVLR